MCCFLTVSKPSGTQFSQFFYVFYLVFSNPFYVSSTVLSRQRELSEPAKDNIRSRIASTKYTISLST